MSGLKQQEVLDLPLRDLIDLVRRCDEFASLLKLTRDSGGRYGRVERLLRDAGDLIDEIERLRQKARL